MSILVCCLRPAFTGSHAAAGYAYQLRLLLAGICIGVAACTSIPGEKGALELIATAEKHFGSNDVGVIGPNTHMAFVYTTRGQHGKAIPHYEKAAELSARHYAVDDIRRTVPMLQLAQAYDLAGHPEKADPLYLESIAQHRKQLARHESELAWSRNKPEARRTPGDQARIEMAALFKPASLPENLEGMIHTLKMHGRNQDVEPLVKRIEWLRLREAIEK